jgi:hypothetical protein
VESGATVQSLDGVFDDPSDSLHLARQTSVDRTWSGGGLYRGHLDLFFSVAVVWAC